MAAPRTSTARTGELKFRQETTAGEAIAVPSTTWASSPKQIRAWDIDTSDMNLLSEDNPAMNTNAFQDLPRLILAKAPCSLKFKTFLMGLAASTPAADPLSLLLKLALGAESLGGALTTVDATNTGAGATVAVKLTSAASFTAGQGIRFGSGLTAQCRRIVSISGVNVTLDMDLSSVLTSGNVYASATYYPSQAPLFDLSDAGHLTLAGFARFFDAEDQRQIRGVSPEFEILDIGKATTMAKLQWILRGMDWEDVTGVAVGTSFTEPNPTAQINSGLYISDQSAVLQKFVHIDNLSIKLGIKQVPELSPSGQQGVIGHTAEVGRTEIEFDTYYDTEWSQGYAAGTLKYAGLQLGSSVLITFPQLNYAEEPKRVGGKNSTKVKVKMYADLGPVTTTELTKARIAIHRFGP